MLRETDAAITTLSIRKQVCGIFFSLVEIYFSFLIFFLKKKKRKQNDGSKSDDKIFFFQTLLFSVLRILIEWYFVV